MSAPDLGKKYQGFYTDSRTAALQRTSRPINKAHQYHQEEKQKNMKKSGEVDEEANERDKRDAEYNASHSEY